MQEVSYQPIAMNNTFAGPMKVAFCFSYSEDESQLRDSMKTLSVTRKKTLFFQRIFFEKFFGEKRKGTNKI